MIVVDVRREAFVFSGPIPSYGARGVTKIQKTAGRGTRGPPYKAIACRRAEGPKSSGIPCFVRGKRRNKTKEFGCPVLNK